MKNILKLSILIFLSIFVFSEALNIVEIAQKGSFNELKKAIATGVDVNQKVKYGKTALHVCAFEDFPEHAELLILSGADVNILNEWGDTPLHIACGCGNLEMVKLLLSKGARTDIKGVNGLLPVDLAIKEKHPEIFNLPEFQPSKNS